MRLILVALLSFSQLIASPVSAAETAPQTDGVHAANALTVPEPGTWLMLTAGLLLMGMSFLRSHRAARQAAANAKNLGIAASRTMR